MRILQHRITTNSLCISTDISCTRVMHAYSGLKLQCKVEGTITLLILAMKYYPTPYS